MRSGFDLVLDRLSGVEGGNVAGVLLEQLRRSLSVEAGPSDPCEVESGGRLHARAVPAVLIPALMPDCLVEIFRETPLRRATSLLERPTMSVETIARNLGCTSGSYYSSAFKEAFGVSPGRFREQRPQLSRVTR